MLPLAAFGADDALVIVVIVVVVAVGGLVAWLRNSVYRLVIAPSATTMPHTQSVTVAIKFQKANWRFGAWNDTPAALTIRVSPVAAVLAPSVMTGTTSTAAPALNLTVVGTNPGSDTLIVTGTEVGGTATARGVVPMIVTQG